MDTRCKGKDNLTTILTPEKVANKEDSKRDTWMAQGKRIRWLSWVRAITAFNDEFSMFLLICFCV